MSESHKLSPHFNREEFDCHNGAHAEPNPRLIKALERLRAICGNKPLRILSGYRSPAYNAALQPPGARNSQHLLNRAADIEPDYATIEQCEEAGFTGIGINRSGHVVHVDMRVTPVGVFHDNW